MFVPPPPARLPAARVPAIFRERPNRFLALAELRDGTLVAAHVPNTGRLHGLLEPGRRVLLRPEAPGSRRTAYTMTRVWDGSWVSIEAGSAPGLLAAWLASGGELPGFGTATALKHEVTVLGHRIDLWVTLTEGRSVWVEVKSGSRAHGVDALLSGTPSQRGMAHLQTLGRLVAAGEEAACTFVIQRGDIERLVVGGDADPGWVESVRIAQSQGVAILAFGCRVTPAAVRLAGPLPIIFES